MKQFKISVLLLALSGILFAFNATANVPQDPIKMLQDVTSNVLQALKQNKAPESNKEIYSVVDKFVIPYVDFNEMSEWVSGRNIWRTAPDKTRQEFISAFKILTVRTYATDRKSVV